MLKGVIAKESVCLGAEGVDRGLGGEVVQGDVGGPPCAGSGDATSELAENVRTALHRGALPTTREHDRRGHSGIEVCSRAASQREDHTSERGRDGPRSRRRLSEDVQPHREHQHIGTQRMLIQSGERRSTHNSITAAK